MELRLAEGPHVEGPLTQQRHPVNGEQAGLFRQLTAGCRHRALPGVDGARRNLETDLGVFRVAQQQQLAVAAPRQVDEDFPHDGKRRVILLSYCPTDQWWWVIPPMVEHRSARLGSMASADRGKVQVLLRAWRQALVDGARCL